MSQKAVTAIPDDEAAIAAGTKLIGPAELAIRIGLKSGRGSRALVIARAKAGIYPFIRPTQKTYLFRWPAVVAALEKSGSATRSRAVNP